MLCSIFYTSNAGCYSQLGWARSYSYCMRRSRRQNCWRGPACTHLNPSSEIVCDRCLKTMMLDNTAQPWQATLLHGHICRTAPLPQD